MKRVIIVKEGQWGGIKEEDYLPLVNLYREVLERAEVPGPYGDGKKEKAARVEVVATVAEAEKKIKEAPLNQRIDVVVFISRGVEVEAERLAKSYPKTRIVVFTGLIPEGKIIWVDKAHCADPKMIENIVLHS